MINDLDRTLEELLRRTLPPDLVRQVTLSFATPDGGFPPPSVSLPAIDLFLYDVRENRELRTAERIIERDAAGKATIRNPPVRIDCSYLITAWPSAGTPNPVQDEHHILSEVMVALLRYPELPDALLQGVLADSRPRPPTSALQSGPLQSMGEFWQALGGKPKASLHFTVTLAVEVSPPEAGAAPATDTRNRSGAENA